MAHPSDDTLAEFQRVLIPMIRKVMPAMVAADITGVQPLGPPFWPQEMEIGETYLNDAAAYSTADDAVEYYWAKPPMPSIMTMRLNGTGGLTDSSEKFNAMTEWTKETFGEVGGRWLYINNKFCFTNEADRMLFVLRWK